MRFPRSLWFWIRAGTLSTQIKRYLITQDSPVKIWEFRICGNGSSTQTTWRDYGESERLLLRRGFLLKSNNDNVGRTASIVGFLFVITLSQKKKGRSFAGMGRGWTMTTAFGAEGGRRARISPFRSRTTAPRC